MVGCARKINTLKFKPRVITCRDYKHYNPDKMNEEFRSLNWTEVYQNTRVNNAWLCIKNLLSNVFDRHAPALVKKVRGKPAPWLTCEVKKLMNERDKALRKSRRTKNDADISQFKLKRNAVNSAVRKAKSTYSKNLLNESSENPNKFWKAIKQIYPTKSRKGAPLQSFEIHGEKSTDPCEVADAFCSFFKNVTQNLKQDSIALRDFVWRPPLPMSNRTTQKFQFRPVSSMEVERQLRSLKRKKSVGFDSLPLGLIKNARSVIAFPLTYLINLSLETGIFPAEWKIAKIIPIHKCGSYLCFDHYRPISTLPVFSKVIEKRIHHQLLKFLEDNKLISTCQFGFRPSMSTRRPANFPICKL